jgi:hypothetical protein
MKVGYSYAKDRQGNIGIGDWFVRDLFFVAEFGSFKIGR